MALTVPQIAGYATAAGFAGEHLIEAVAVALAESGGRPDAVNTAGNHPPSRDRGLWQINDHWHPEVSDAEAFDPLSCARAAYRISSRGESWKPWATWANGSAQRRIPEVRHALNPTPQQPPEVPPMSDPFARPDDEPADVREGPQPGEDYPDEKRYVGACPHPAGGVWLLRENGGVDAVDGAPFYGSIGDLHTDEKRGSEFYVAIVPWAGHDGYIVVRNDGALYRFDSAVWDYLRSEAHGIPA